MDCIRFALKLIVRGDIANQSNVYNVSLERHSTSSVADTTKMHKL